MIKNIRKWILTGFSEILFDSILLSILFLMIVTMGSSMAENNITLFLTTLLAGVFLLIGSAIIQDNVQTWIKQY